jgi:hypothetical protein
VPGDYNTKGKLVFESNPKAWEMMKTMRGRKFDVEINGHRHVLWHGFDKTKSEQLTARRSMHVYSAVKSLFVQFDLCAADAPFDWMKKNLMDLDSEVGTIFIKVGATAEAAKVTHDVTRLLPGGEIATRKFQLDEVVKIVVSAKGQQQGDRLQETITAAVEAANQLTEIRED